MSLDYLTQLVLPLAEPFFLKVSALLVVLIIVTIPLEVSVPPIAQKFRLDNKYINYPLVSEHVPVYLLAICSIIIPFAAIVQIAVFTPRFRPQIAVAILGLALTIISTMFVTDVLKLLIGNQRPDFIARCIPLEGLATDKWLTVREACTNPNWPLVLEGCKSTPSGHSSLSFAGLLFVSLALKRVRSATSKFPVVTCFAPLILATYIAATRLVDHRHHWIDVISGSIIGSILSFITWTFVVERPVAQDEGRHAPLPSDPQEV